jgi:hypothetical protein
MSSTSVTAPLGAAQDHFSYNQNADENRVLALSALPWRWQRGLLAIGKNKQPIDARSGRPLKDWPTSPVPSTAQLLKAPAVGLRTGSLTGTLCLDFDGPDAWQAFEAVFKGTADHLLPPTIAWTSGKPQRCQMAFAIAPEHHRLLKGKRRKIGALELRWDGAQSVLMGHHPETGAYHWLDGRAPWEQQLAEFPLELLALVPDVAPAPQVAPHVAPHVAGLVVPLEQFITLRSRLLIENGSAEGSCNADALALSMDLVAAEQWLKVQGVGVDRTAQELFEDYCRQCPDTVNGRPFDLRAMQARFDGAVKRCPSPPTPEPKLLERLDYHRRAARRAHPRSSGFVMGVAA